MRFAEFRQFAIEHALESLDDTFVSAANGESAEKILGRSKTLSKAHISRSKAN
jgi:hypothetical protein